MSAEAPLRRALLAAILLLSVVLAFRFFVPVDDAYISFRYSENLASGHGLVFNPGERVEGYSNFLWVILLAFARVLGIPVVAAAQWLGLLCHAASILLAADLGRRLNGAASWGGFPAALLLAAQPAVAAWAGGGMETPLFAFLCLLTAHQFEREREAGTSAPWRWSAAALLASMTRPEGVLVFLTAFAMHAREAYGRKDPARRVWMPALPFLLVGAPYFIWRIAYFGHLLPNTFAAKAGLDDTILRHGIFYFVWFLIQSGGAILVAGALLAIGDRRPLIRMLLIQGLLLSLVAILMGGDAYPYSRFLVPVAALLAPAAETGYRLAWSRLASWKPILRPARVIPVALVLLLVSGEIWSAFTGLNYLEFARDAEGEARRRPIGEYLRRTAPPGTLVAMNPVGIIPYFSGLPTLDQLGLTDAHIARRGHRIVNRVLFAHDRYDADYVLARRPGIIILGQATVLGVDPRMTDLRREGPATFPAITPAITRELHGFPGDEALWYKPDFRRLYQPTIARIDDGFFFHFVLDRRAHDLMQRSAGGHGTAAEDAEMAALLQAKGETRLALEAMRQAESKDPSYAGRRAELEQALSAPIRQSAALEDSKSVLRRMEADLGRGDAAGAEKDLLEGIQASPGNAELVYNLAVLYEQTARLAEAEDAYRRVLKLDPESYDAWNNLGTIYARQGDLKQARTCWEQAVALNPASPAADNLRRLEAMKP